MANKIEYVDLSGLRVDGRRPHELRKINARMGVLAKPNGSALLEQGNTKVLVSVYGPRRCEHRSKELHNRAVVTCECSVAPYAMTGERKKRSRGDRLTNELATMLRQTFESLLFSNIFPRSQVDFPLSVSAHGPYAISS